MFGLDKLFGGSGLFGKFFDSIGMGWMTNVLSLAANVMTGNWIAAAKDVFDLVSQFSNSWMNKVSQNQPLGEFSTGGCFGTDSFSGLRADQLRDEVNAFDPDGENSFTRAIYVAQETIYNSTVANRNLAFAQASQRA